MSAAGAAEVERLSIAFSVEGGGGIHGHAADEVDSFGFRRIHGAVSFVCCYCPSVPVFKFGEK